MQEMLSGGQGITQIQHFMQVHALTGKGAPIEHLLNIVTTGSSPAAEQI
jgi:hypothetical protein